MGDYEASLQKTRENKIIFNFTTFPVLIAALIAGIPKMVDYFDSSSDITKLAVLAEDPVFAKSLAADKNHFKVNTDIKDKKIRPVCSERR